MYECKYSKYSLLNSPEQHHEWQNKHGGSMSAPWIGDQIVDWQAIPGAVLSLSQAEPLSYR